MSGLWVPEERNGTGEPILDLWEPKSGHLRFHPRHVTRAKRWEVNFVVVDVVRPRVGASFILGGCRI